MKERLEQMPFGRDLRLQSDSPQSTNSGEKKEDSTLVKELLATKKWLLNQDRKDPKQFSAYVLTLESGRRVCVVQAPQSRFNSERFSLDEQNEAILLFASYVKDGIYVIDDSSDALTPTVLPKDRVNKLDDISTLSGTGQMITALDILKGAKKVIRVVRMIGARGRSQDSLYHSSISLAGILPQETVSLSLALEFILKQEEKEKIVVEQPVLALVPIAWLS